MRVINNIVLHCTATPQTATVEAIQKYWRNNLGWKSPGYHRIILPDGSIKELAGFETICNGVKGHNANSIHVSYIGGVDGQNRAVDNRTTAQRNAMALLVKSLKEKYPKAKVCGHRDFPGVQKACPSFDVATWLKEVKLA